MADDRIQTDLWLRAHIRRSNDAGIPMMVVKRGDAQSGSVLVKINRLGDGCTVLSQTRTTAGTMAWLPATGPEPVAEADADAYIQRQLRYDPDLWVVEIEDRAGRHPFQETIL